MIQKFEIVSRLHKGKPILEQNTGLFKLQPYTMVT